MRRGIAIAGVFLGVLVPGSGLAAETPARRPNIILLVLDDQDAYTPFWDAMPATAAMTRDRGTVFTTALAPTPICTPSRATLLSGRLAHNTGCFTLSGPHGARRFLKQIDRTFPVELERLGYTTAMFGKSWASKRIDPGWSEWMSLGGPHMYEGYGYRVTEQLPGRPPEVYTSATYSTDFLSERLARFLRERRDDPRPFFAWVAPTAPHLPLPPAQRHRRRARERWQGGLPIRPNFDEADVSDKPGWLRASAASRSEAVPYARGEYPKRMGSLLAVDEMMARAREILVAQGQWDSTILVVTSDNGYNLGSHRLLHKFGPYEESVRIPLVMAGPAVPRAEVARIVGLQDLAPTFIELAGGHAPPDCDGRSLVPFFSASAGHDPAWRTEQVLEYDCGGVHPGYNPGGSMRVGYSLDLPSYRALRTDSHKYIRWLASGEQEVYDLRVDPCELDNLMRTDPARGEPLRAALSDRLDALLPCAGAGCP